MVMRKSRISWYKQEKLISHFVAGSTARTAGVLVGVNFKSSACYFRRLRELIVLHEPRYNFLGEVEVDESYFGGRRKGKRGRGAGGKVAVFGLLKRGGKVYTVIIPDAKTKTLLPIIEESVEPDSIVYTDTFRSYEALDVSDFYHMRINHSE
jgi:transposase